MDTVKTLFASGHRPAKGTYDIAHPQRQEIRKHCYNAIFRAYTHANFNTFITGMAQGFDQDFALCVIQLRLEMKGGIYLIAALPFIEQSQSWSKKAQYIYDEIIFQCDSVVEVSSPGYADEKYQLRNQFMVNQADEGVVFWNGSNGGTRNCIRYARAAGKRVVNLLDVDVATA